MKLPMKRGYLWKSFSFDPHLLSSFTPNQELKETRKKLEELTEKRDDLGKETQKMRDDLTEAQEEIKRTGRELKDLKARVKGTVDEKDSLSGVSRWWDLRKEMCWHRT